jgi:hypothetical protein
MLPQEFNLSPRSLEMLDVCDTEVPSQFKNSKANGAGERDKSISGLSSAPPRRETE